MENVKTSTPPNSNSQKHSNRTHRGNTNKQYNKRQRQNGAPHRRNNNRRRPANRDHSAQFNLQPNTSTPSEDQTTPLLTNVSKPQSNIDFSSQNWKSQLAPPEKDTRVQTDDVLNTTGLSWDDFDLKRPLIAGLYEAGWDSPSPIQEASLEYTLKGKSILARAKNGTGKTGSYLIPILQNIDPKATHIQALILSPTRELSLQTSEVCRELAKHINGIQVMVTFGGSNLKEDILRLKGTVHILIGTPGRLRDVVERKVANLSKCSMVALDEADCLLAPSLSRSIEGLIDNMPKSPQILLLSATYPKSILSFRENYCPESEIINLMDELTLSGVTQFYAHVKESVKLRCLHMLFNTLQIKQSIIFCNSVRRVELLAKNILKLGYSCYYIHSQMPQEHRNRVFHDFRRGKCRNLVCSDVFSRGIDVQAVNVVINFDFPTAADTYLHRIGRSGRYGHLGIAINFVTLNDRKNLFMIEDKLETEISQLPKVIDPKLYVSDGFTESVSGTSGEPPGTMMNNTQVGIPHSQTTASNATSLNRMAVVPPHQQIVANDSSNIQMTAPPDENASVNYGPPVFLQSQPKTVVAPTEADILDQL